MKKNQHRQMTAEEKLRAVEEGKQRVNWNLSGGDTRRKIAALYKWATLPLGKSPLLTGEVEESNILV